MKRFLCMMVVVCLFLCAAAGCSAPIKEDGAQSAWDLTEVEPVYLTQWPENEFTEQIIEPEHGEIDYVCDYSDSMRYLVVMKNMPEEASSDYVEELKEQGYAEIASDGNDVSVGTMLERDGVILGIAYSGETLGVLITLENSR